MKTNKKLRKILIKLQNQLGKNEGKTIWLLQKKEWIMAWPHKNRPRKGRRKVGSQKRKARRFKGRKRK